jgi:hypothetical protein
LGNPKITVHADKPSDQIVKQAKQEATITDSRGRVIELRKPDPLAQFRLIEVVGGAAAENRIYMGMVFPLLFVTSVGGTPVPAIQSKTQLEALIQRLDEDGITAVSTGVNEHFAPKSEDEFQEQVKN